ncbi:MULTISPECIES: hypothetical protein [unclassified Pseudomonas]|uniref:hypothetical protein n=1 Tax=unclassified Pseudomonas TaxID=196821 RepID=UPI0021145B36|nr:MULTISPECIES: hypothetical protein [unclassified Pseudomonas]
MQTQKYGCAVLAIHHDGTRAAAVQCEIAAKVFDEFNDLLIDIPLGAFAGRTNCEVVQVVNLDSILVGVPARLVQRAMTELILPRQLMYLLNDCRH